MYAAGRLHVALPAGDCIRQPGGNLRLLSSEIVLLTGVPGQVIEAPGGIEPVLLGAHAYVAVPVGEDQALGPAFAAAQQERGKADAVERLAGRDRDARQLRERRQQVNGRGDWGHSRPRPDMAGPAHQ